MEHTPEELELNSVNEQNAAKKEYEQHSIAQRVAAFVLVGIILFGFLGMCYWLAFYGV